MRWADLPRNPSVKVLRQFAGLWIVFFGGLAYWHGVVHARPAVGIVLASLAVTVGPLGLARPKAVRPIFVGWMVLAFPIGWALSRVILASVYYGLFTPLAVGFRLRGRDALGLRRPQGQKTYWTLKSIPTDQRSYFRPC